MERTSVQFIAAACGGQVYGQTDASIDGVVIDSRLAREGAMFVAYIGPNRDGHDFVRQAFDLGCRVFFISRSERIPELLSYGSDVCVIRTAHTEQDLVRTAEAYLAQFSLHRVALTGSVGKTTTKEMTAAVLAQKYRTIYTEGNLNTTLGQCLTAFRAGADTQAIVFEMGMDRPGEIESYCRWIRPHIAMITNAGTAHMEYLGSREAIAREKLQIASHLGCDDVLIFNCDSPFLSADEVDSALGDCCRLRPVGTGPQAAVRVESVQRDGHGIRFTLSAGTGYPFILPIPGRHNALNAALAVACGLELGVSMEQAAQALADVRPADRRLCVEEAAGITLIDDSYNAGPDSMRAALDVLAETDGTRRIAVLADILELGRMREEGHLAVGRAVAETSPDVLVAVGSDASYYVAGARQEGFSGHSTHLSEPSEALSWLLPQLSEGDVILVKGSNSTGISAVAAGVRAYIREKEAER
ncbi:MAG TPA: UDP-N-acetylmuramoyl-tripeptide--D-alanyl-D-alanine ligase [Clostridiales bacterium]|nr:UDP-N-acetylmuramoyl-tripeptide--D-alanyl-D-alanine ligase [Clostridiales bacterium]